MDSSRYQADNRVNTGYRRTIQQLRQVWCRDLPGVVTGASSYQCFVVVASAAKNLVRLSPVRPMYFGHRVALRDQRPPLSSRPYLVQLASIPQQGRPSGSTPITSESWEAATG